jgi:hypothetical protein
MKTWKDLTIGTRLAASFGLILLCLIAVGGVGLSWLGRLNTEMSTSLQSPSSCLKRLIAKKKNN